MLKKEDKDFGNLYLQKKQPSLLKVQPSILNDFVRT